MSDLPKLPPLPPIVIKADRKYLGGYLQENVEAYGTACWNAAIEWAAGECDKMADAADGAANPERGEGCFDCADVIRAGGKR